MSLLSEPRTATGRRSLCFALAVLYTLSQQPAA